MSLSGTTENIRQLLKNDITVTVDEEEIQVITDVWHGAFDEKVPMSGKVAATVQAESEEGDLNFPGRLDIPLGPYDVPIYITIHVKGSKNKAFPRLYDIVDLVRAELLKDMSFGDTCTSAHFPEGKRVLYSELESVKTGKHLTVAATFIIIANYSE